MYPGPNVIGGGIATGGGALAATGTNTPWLVVAGVTIVLAGLAITRLMPKRKKFRA